MPCGLSGCNAKDTFVCSRCKHVRYCSREHQTGHWKEHKKTCVYVKAKSSSPKPSSEASSSFILLRFSKFIAVPIFTEWLNAKEFLKLDSSLCNQQSRVLFLNWCSEYKTLCQKAVFQLSKPTMFSTEIYHWCIARNFSLPTVYKKMVVKTFLKIIRPHPVVLANSVFNNVNVEELTVDFVDKFMPDPYTKNFFTQFRNLKVLKFQRAYGSVLSFLTDTCTTLTDCDVSGQHGITHEIVQIVRNCSHLTKLDVSFCSGINSILPSIGIHGRKLQYLIIDKCNTEMFLQDRALIIFSMHRQCYLKDLMNYQPWSPNAGNALIWYKGASLTELNFKICGFIRIGDFGIACPNLVSVDLSYLQFVRDDELTRMVPKLSKLTTLILDLLDITDESLLAVTLHCRQLKKLSLSMSLFTVNALKTIANLINLTSLSIHQVWSLNDDSLTHIVSNCRKLQVLSLKNDIEMSDNFSVITDVSMIAISNHCYKTLTSFHMNKCNYVTDRGLTMVLTNCKLLTDINIHSCALITIEPYDKFYYLDDEDGTIYDEGEEDYYPDSYYTDYLSQYYNEVEERGPHEWTYEDEWLDYEP